MNFTKTLSLKVTPDFLALVRIEAAECGLDLSDFLRQRLGLAILKKSRHSNDKTLLSSLNVGQITNTPKRPQHLKPPNGSDPKVICMLACIANSLRDVASSLCSEAEQVSMPSGECWLAVMHEIEGHLATLISREDDKNAH